MKGLLSATHASQLFGKSLRTFLRRAIEWKIEPVPFGKKHFYRAKDVEWMKKQELGR